MQKLHALDTRGELLAPNGVLYPANIGGLYHDPVLYLAITHNGSGFPLTQQLLAENGTPAIADCHYIYIRATPTAYLRIK